MGVEEKKREKRQRLIQSGLHLFSEQGFGVTTVEDITRKAGVAKGTFYLYFRDKHHLLTEILGGLASQHEEDYRRLKKISCPRERIGKYIASQLSFYKENAGLARFTLISAGAEVQVQSLINWYLETQKRHIIFLAETIEEGCQKGIFSVEDSFKAARFLRGAIFMFLAHQVFDPEALQDISSDTDFIMRTFLKGIETGTLTNPVP